MRKSTILSNLSNLSFLPFLSFMIAFVLALVLAINTGITVFGADNSIVLKINDNTMTVDGTNVQLDTAPVIIDGRTLIPVRGMSEAMGGKVEWNNQDKTVTITNETDVIKLIIDSRTAYLNDKQQSLDTAPIILNGRTMLPARFIAESFGYNVNWNDKNKTILITQNNEVINADNEKSDDINKSIVVYFSKTGTTERIANEIKNITDSDITKVEPVNPYPENYNETVQIADNEKKESARPEIKVSINNFDDYDTIYLGYPIWWGTMPMAMFTFIENYDLSGKTIVPFCTNLGSGLGSSVNDLKKALPNSIIKNGLAGNSSTSTEQIQNWIENTKD